MGKPSGPGGNHGMSPQTPAPSAVKKSAPGPNVKQVPVNKTSAPAAPNRGQTARSSQGGSTSPRTDGGGGVGNTAADLDRMLKK